MPTKKTVQVKVTPTEQEVLGIRDYVASRNPTNEPTWLVMLIGRLNKALDKSAAPAKSKKKPGCIQILNRPDLKFEPTRFHVIAGESIGYDWRLTGQHSETCAHCNRPLGGARVTFLGRSNGSIAPIHRACSNEAFKPAQMIARMLAPVPEVKDFAGLDLTKPWEPKDCPTWHWTDQPECKAMESIANAILAIGISMLKSENEIAA